VPEKQGRPVVSQKMKAVIRPLGAFALYTLAALILFQPWLAQFGSVLIGSPENNLQDFWNVWHATHTSLGNFFHTDDLRFPGGTSLLFHSFSYPHVAAVAALASWLGNGRDTLIVLNNAALLASFPLAGLTAFYLVRRFVPQDWAALIGGFLFAFSPWHVAQLGHHAHVTHIEFVPLFVLAYLNALERKSTRWLIAAAVSGALAALSCWYYLFYAAYFVLFHTVYVRWHDKQRLTGWQLKAPVLTIAGMGLLVAPLIVPMLLASGGVEHPGGTDAFVADVEAFVAFPPTHIFAAWSAPFWTRLQTWTSNNTFEGAAYLGLINIAVMAVLWRRRRTDRLANYVFWAMAVFAVLAMGDCIHAFGYDTLIPIPGIIPNHLPFFSQVRTPGRAMVIVYLFLSVGVAYGLTLLAEKWRAKPRGKAALAGIVVLIVADFAPVHFEFTDARCPQGLSVIAADHAPGFGVLNLPIETGGDVAMFQQTCHGKPVVVAAISRQVRPPLTDTLDRRNLAVQRAQLIKAHVKYLVVDERADWEPDRNPPKYALRRWAVRTFPALAKVKGIGLPPYKAPIPKSAYESTFPAVYRDAGMTILKVQ
jgi:hypothetical protein